MDIKVKVGLSLVGGVVSIFAAGLIRNKLRDRFSIVSVAEAGSNYHISIRKKIAAGILGQISVIGLVTVLRVTDDEAYLTYWSETAQHHLELTEEEVEAVLDYLVSVKGIREYHRLVGSDGVWHFKYN
jgi:hypothetical protein